jgi:hypothetical protein
MLSLFAQAYQPVDSGTYGVGFPEAGILFFFLLPLIVLTIVGLWKVFEKAGIPGWKALIPVYNSWLLMEMAGKPGWWALVGLAGVIPVLGFIASIIAFVLYVIAALELGKAFGKSQMFSVFGLVIFSLVGFLMLGFGNDKYNKPATAPAQFS